MPNVCSITDVAPNLTSFHHGNKAVCYSGIEEGCNTFACGTAQERLRSHFLGSTLCFYAECCSYPQRNPRNDTACQGVVSHWFLIDQKEPMRVTHGCPKTKFELTAKYCNSETVGRKLPVLHRAPNRLASIVMSLTNAEYFWLNIQWDSLFVLVLQRFLAFWQGSSRALDEIMLRFCQNDIKDESGWHRMLTYLQCWSLGKLIRRLLPVQKHPRSLFYPVISGVIIKIPICFYRGIFFREYFSLLTKASAGK